MDSKLSPTLWEKFPIKSNRGFNPLPVITAAIGEIFPWAEVGFFTASDLEDRRAVEGYVVLTPANWNEYSEWNENVAMRYGLSERNGGLCWKNLYVCVRPKNVGDQRRAVIHAESENRFSLVADAKAREISQATGFGAGSSSVESFVQAAPKFYTEGNQDEADTDPTTNAGTPRRGRPPKGAGG